MTTVTLSVALKSELERIRDDNEFGSLNDTILDILRNPRTGSRSIRGKDDVLTQPVAVDEFTRHILSRVRDREGYEDYEAVIRDRAGIAQRDTGERPIDLNPLPS